MLRLSLTLVLLMAACAALSKQVQVAERQPAPASKGSTAGKDAVASVGPEPEGKIVCRMERPIGSNIAERVCRYIEDVERNRQRTQDILLAPQTNTRPPN
jgi:hypothetical protein